MDIKTRYKNYLLKEYLYSEKNKEGIFEKKIDQIKFTRDYSKALILFNSAFVYFCVG